MTADVQTIPDTNNAVQDFLQDFLKELNGPTSTRPAYATIFQKGFAKEKHDRSLQKLTDGQSSTYKKMEKVLSGVTTADYKFDAKECLDFYLEKMTAEPSMNSNTQFRELTPQQQKAVLLNLDLNANDDSIEKELNKITSLEQLKKTLQDTNQNFHKRVSNSTGFDPINSSIRNYANLPNWSAIEEVKQENIFKALEKLDQQVRQQNEHSAYLIDENHDFLKLGLGLNSDEHILAELQEKNNERGDDKDTKLHLFLEANKKIEEQLKKLHKLRQTIETGNPKDRAENIEQADKALSIIDQQLETLEQFKRSSGKDTYDYHILNTSALAMFGNEVDDVVDEEQQQTKKQKLLDALFMARANLDSLRQLRKPEGHVQNAKNKVSNAVRWLQNPLKLDREKELRTFWTSRSLTEVGDVNLTMIAAGESGFTTHALGIINKMQAATLRLSPQQIHEIIMEKTSAGPMGGKGESLFDQGVRFHIRPQRHLLGWGSAKNDGSYQFEITFPVGDQASKSAEALFNKMLAKSEENKLEATQTKAGVNINNKRNDGEGNSVNVSSNHLTPGTQH